MASRAEDYFAEIRERQDYLREIVNAEPILTHVCILAICPDCILQGYETRDTAQAQAAARAQHRDDLLLARYRAATTTESTAAEAS